MLWVPLAFANEPIVTGEVVLDRATVTSLGVRWPFYGDEDGDAEVNVRFRGPDGVWKSGLRLHRVRPENVVGMQVDPEYAGSIFGLLPDTEYDLELIASDPDGAYSMSVNSGRTRAVPTDPSSPNEVRVSSNFQLAVALYQAQPGDVITLDDGQYDGQFDLLASGTQNQPIVIRGETRDGAIIDGNGCEDGDGVCNALLVFGSWVHVEQLTIQDAERGLGFVLPGAVGNVARNLRIRNVELGIGSAGGQRDFYVCDNEVLGPLVWPQIFTDDDGRLNTYDGITVDGEGHVVCHNRVVGFGDAVRIAGNGRSVDIIGNDIEDNYDDAIELDGGLGNLRVLHNRITNTYSAISFEPIYGGPAYAIRNFAVNVAHEQLKFDAFSNGYTPRQEPSGLYAAHNTFLSPDFALRLDDESVTHQFEVRGNLFVGGEQTIRTLDWSAGVDEGTFDGNGWWPDGEFRWTWVGAWESFAALSSSGVYEATGVLLEASPLASGTVAPIDYRVHVAPTSPALVPTSKAIDAGLFLPNVNDGYTGAGPDLGAHELGCPDYPYGPRAEGIDEDDPLPPCEAGSTTPTGTQVTGDSGEGDPLDDVPGGTEVPGPPEPDFGFGCGCAGAPPSSVGWFGVAILGIGRRRRRIAGRIQGR